MWIVTGTKEVRRQQGYVADFCELCNSIQAFRIDRLGLAGHVLHIAVSPGELLGFERRCECCHTTTPAKLERYRQVAPVLLCLAELQAATFPAVVGVMQVHQAAQAGAVQHPAALLPAERGALIRSPFLLLSNKVERRYASTHVDARVVLCMGIALLVAVLGPAVFLATFEADPVEVALAFIALALVGVACEVRLGNRRFMTREIVPVLVRMLQPLQPSAAELQQTVADLRDAGHVIGRTVLLRDLLAQLAGVASVPGGRGARPVVQQAP